MPHDVSPDEFSDELIEKFFDEVEKLKWRAVGGVPPWISEEADRFAATLPRARPDVLRDHIAHAVAVARGWDDPDDRRVMFHTAVKSFYLLAWLEYLQARVRERADVDELNLSAAYSISFTPEFRGGEPPI